MLAFKLPYAEAICDGRKVQTIRAKRPNFLVGDVIPATCRWGRPAFARLRVIGIEEISFADLDDDIAAADGFNSASELRKVVCDLYPGVDALYAIRFEVLEHHREVLEA